MNFRPLFFFPAFLCLGSVASFAQQDRLVPVEVEQAIEGSLVRPVEFVGTVTARKQAELSPRLSGLIEEMNVDFGSEVSQGDLLLKLDATLAVIELERVEQSLKAAGAQLDDARRRFEETEKVAKGGGISGSELDSSRSILNVREAEYNRLLVELKHQSEIVARHELRAPFSGVISRRLVQEGEWVQAQDAVLELTELDVVYFDVQAPQDLFDQVDRNTQVEIVTGRNGNSYQPAKVLVKVPFKNPVNRTFLLRLIPEGKSLLPGASGKARFYMSGSESVISINRDALVRQPDGSYAVWVLDKESGKSTAAVRSVETGVNVGSKVEIVGGLLVGETVVIRGNESLQPGQEVRVVNPK